MLQYEISMHQYKFQFTVFSNQIRLVRGLLVQRRWHTDQRIQWLKEQYLQLYYEADRKQGPTPAEAIKVFGGKNWGSDPTSPSQNLEVESLSSASRIKRTFSTITRGENSPKISLLRHAHTVKRKQPAASSTPHHLKVSKHPFV